MTPVSPHGLPGPSGPSEPVRGRNPPEGHLADDRFISRLAGRLLPKPEPIPELVPDWTPDVPHERPPVPAAVLIALVDREDGLSVLYTERSPALRSHSGQVAFPGGKVDPTDVDAAAAALREANEEVALDPLDARVLGYMPQYYTGTNYLITPVVALVAPRQPFLPNPDEVRSVFEVPLAYLMQEASFTIRTISRNGRQHATRQVEHSGLVIWGITANLTWQFHELAAAARAE